MTNKYLITGQEVKVVTEVDGEYIVYLMMEDYDTGEPYEGHLQRVHKVYDEPPTTILHEGVAKLRKQRDNLQRELVDLRGAIQREERGRKDIMETLDQYEKLQFLKDYLDGKITHVLVKGRYGFDHNIRILSQKQLKSEYGGFKAIALFGGLKKYGRTVPNDKLVWRINRYSDGSGVYDYTALSFHTCKEDAVQAGKEYLQELIKPVEGDDPVKPNSELIKKLEQFGVPVPPEFHEYIKEQERKKLVENIEHAERQLADLKQDLREHQDN